MGQDSDNLLESKFEVFREKIEFIREQKDLFSGMFSFGIDLGSDHYKTDRFWQRRQAMKVIHDDLRGQWDSQLFLKVQGGRDDNGKKDEDFGGIVYWEYCIKRAVEFSRPDWAFYYWIGELKGKLNAGEVESAEFLRCLQFIPVTFFGKHGKRIVELCNYFDEKGEDLHLEIKDGKVNAWFEKK